MAQTDRDALLALYNATDGPNWKNKTNWNTDADLSEWHGVDVNEGRVAKLRLIGNNLRGNDSKSVHAPVILSAPCT